MVIPEFIRLIEWAHTLIIDFPNDNIPLLIDESNWKEWGDRLVQEESFIENNAPGTYHYNDWNKWANEVYFIMSNN